MKFSVFLFFREKRNQQNKRIISKKKTKKLYEIQSKKDIKLYSFPLAQDVTFLACQHYLTPYCSALSAIVSANGLTLIKIL